LRAFRITSDRTAAMMVAASVEFGRKNSNGLRNIVASAMPTAVKAPVVSDRNPVIARRDPSSGRRLDMKLPVPNIVMTRERPTKRRTAVSISSEG